MRRRRDNISRLLCSGGAGGTSVVIGDLDEARQKSKIVNLIQIAGDDQVTLKVTVAEVSRTVMKQLGVNLVVNGVGNGISFTGLSQNVAALGQPLSQSGAAIGGTIGNTSIAAYLNAMEIAGVMKTLAEPSLTAISGEKATFKVGGEYNIFSGQDVDDNGRSPARTTRSSMASV